MDWTYFRDPKTGAFRLKRLPPIKTPIPVKDISEIGLYRSDYEGLPFDTALQHYQSRFDGYEVELGEHDGLFESAPAKYLGELSAFRRDTSLFWSLMEIENLADDSHAVSVSKTMAEKLVDLVRIVEPTDGDAIRAALSHYSVAELKEICAGLGLLVGGKKADLVQRLAEHERTNPGTVPTPAMIMPTPALKERYQQCCEGIVEALIEQLASYPDRYRRLVLEEVATDFNDEYFDIRDVIARQAGIELEPQAPVVRKTKKEWSGRTAAENAEQAQYRTRSKAASKRGLAKPVQVALLIAAIAILWLIFR